eukprot:562769-Prorocentrum_lima.AAC.1
MTSSLVGSEMCIRDRSTSCSSWSLMTSGEKSGLGPLLGGLELLNGSWPVSYTHLTLPTICSV